MPQFFVPLVDADKQEDAYTEMAALIGAAIAPPANRIYSMTWKHNDTEWTATVGEQLHGIATIENGRGRSKREIRVRSAIHDHARQSKQDLERADLRQPHFGDGVSPRLSQAAFFEFLPATARAKFISPNLHARCRCSGRSWPSRRLAGHSARESFQGTVMLPRIAQLYPELRQPVIGTNRKAKPAFSAMHIFTATAVVGQLFGRLGIGQRSAMDGQPTLTIVEAERQIMAPAVPAGLLGNLPQAAVEIIDRLAAPATIGGGRGRPVPRRAGFRYSRAPGRPACP